MTERPPSRESATRSPDTPAPGATPPWHRAELADGTPRDPTTRAHEHDARYDADDQARMLYLRNMSSIADQRRQYWEDALRSITRRTTFVYLTGVVVFTLGISLVFVGAWLISRDNTWISATPTMVGGLSEAALIPVTKIERGLAKDKISAERALDRQSTIAHVSGIAAMTAADGREHILADLAARLIATIDEP